MHDLLLSRARERERRREKGARDDMSTVPCGPLTYDI
jgi:hypothetical protein